MGKADRREAAELMLAEAYVLLERLKEEHLQLASREGFRAVSAVVARVEEAVDWENMRRQQWWWREGETEAQANRRLDRQWERAMRKPYLPKVKRGEQLWL